MTTQRHLFRAAALAALAFFAVTAGHAQGLGGMLNKAKAKVGQATNAATNPAQAAAQAAPGTTGELPEPPNELTVENQQQYARMCLADNRPVVLGQGTGSPTYYYRQLHQRFHMPLVFTWDEAAVKLLTERRMDLWNPCRDISEDLLDWLDSNQGAYLKPALAKVKQIHLTTTPKPISTTASLTDPSTHGYYCSFNPATGVLTAAISVPDRPNRVSADAAFGHWIQKNVK